jgi:hypothetical protein
LKVRLDRCGIIKKLGFFLLLVRYIRHHNADQMRLRFMRVWWRIQVQSSLWSQFCLLRVFLDVLLVKPAAYMIWSRFQDSLSSLVENVGDIGLHFELSKYGPRSFRCLHELSCHDFTTVSHEKLAHVQFNRQHRSRYLSDTCVIPRHTMFSSALMGPITDLYCIIQLFEDP